MLKIRFFLMSSSSLISDLESVIRVTNEYVESGKEAEYPEEIQKHLSSVEKLIIELAQSVSDYRTFHGTNPHLFREMSNIEIVDE